METRNSHAPKVYATELHINFKSDEGEMRRALEFTRKMARKHCIDDQCSNSQGKYMCCQGNGPPCEHFKKEEACGMKTAQCWLYFCREILDTFTEDELKLIRDHHDRCPRCGSHQVFSIHGCETYCECCGYVADPVFDNLLRLLFRTKQITEVK